MPEVSGFLQFILKTPYMPFNQFNRIAGHPAIAPDGFNGLSESIKAIGHQHGLCASRELFKNLLNVNGSAYQIIPTVTSTVIKRTLKVAGGRSVCRNEIQAHALHF